MTKCRAESINKWIFSFINRTRAITLIIKQLRFYYTVALIEPEWIRANLFTCIPDTYIKKNIGTSENVNYFLQCRLSQEHPDTFPLYFTFLFKIFDEKKTCYSWNLLSWRLRWYWLTVVDENCLGNQRWWNSIIKVMYAFDRSVWMELCIYYAEHAKTNQKHLHGVSNIMTGKYLILDFILKLYMQDFLDGLFTKRRSIISLF